MTLNLASLIVLPLIAACALSARRLVLLMMALSPFEAAAVLVVGGRGVVPSYLPALTFLGLIGLHAALGSRFARAPAVVLLTRPLILALCYMIASAALMPLVFENTVMVWPEKADPDSWWPIPLQPNSSNVAQCVYVVLDALISFSVALVVSCWNMSTREIYRGFLFCALLAEVFAFWQFASRTAHVPFPTALIDSNPSIHILSEQNWGGIPRVNGTFSEPAALAFFLSGVIYSTAWLTLTQQGSRLITAVLLLGCASLIISTSTTGYATIGLGGVGLTLWVATRASPRIARRFWSIALPLFAAGLCAAVFAALLAPHLIDILTRIGSETASKSVSQSFAARTQSDIDSLKEVLLTFGLGVGWGSNRSSSFIPGVLSGAGVVGAALIVWFAFGLFRRIGSVQAERLSADERRMVSGGGAALIGWLVAACLSGPTITSIPFFVVLGGVIGVLCHPGRLRDAAAAWRSAQAPPDARLRAHGT